SLQRLISKDILKVTSGHLHCGPQPANAMAKSKPSHGRRDVRDKRAHNKSLNKVLPGRPASKKPSESAEDLLVKASALVETSQAEEALSLALRALAQLVARNRDSKLQTLPALNLVAEIYLELGDADAARDKFLEAAAIDEDGSVPEEKGGGAAKFLWLAQLSEEGGQDSVSWFQKAITVLRNGLASTPDETETALKRKSLAEALCSVVEIYMTDLSWEPDAETRCESLITEAILICPESPEALQTLASVRISQTKVDEARKALAQSIEMWKDLAAGDDGVPDFPTRISLVRLLMEVEMEEEAMEVLDRLIEEDDSSVETWYLGGWCQYLMIERKVLASASTSSSNNKDLGEETLP
ncbi:MAG: hypothetical protein Q9174_007355, partial [Haloplaca sp. 1 TL-2023]